MARILVVYQDREKRPGAHDNFIAAMNESAGGLGFTRFVAPYWFPLGVVLAWLTFPIIKRNALVETQERSVT